MIISPINSQGSLPNVNVLLFSSFWIYMLVTPFNLIYQRLLTVSEIRKLWHITIWKTKYFNLCLVPAYLSYPIPYYCPLCFSAIVALFFSVFLRLAKLFLILVLWNFFLSVDLLCPRSWQTHKLHFFFIIPLVLYLNFFSFQLFFISSPHLTFLKST